MDDTDIADAWNVAEEPFDPTKTGDKEEAVFIGQQATGDTIIVGKEDRGEWRWVSRSGPNVTLDSLRVIQHGCIRLTWDHSN